MATFNISHFLTNLREQVSDADELRRVRDELHASNAKLEADDARLEERAAALEAGAGGPPAPVQIDAGANSIHHPK